MATYRPNPTDKQQVDLERFNDHSAIRVFWFNGRLQQTGDVKNFKANDLQPGSDAAGSSGSAALVPPAVPSQAANRRMVVGSHNDKAWRFNTPGKA